MPTEGYVSGAISSDSSFLKRETSLAAACRMDWRGARVETRRKIRRPAAAIVKETDDGGPYCHGGSGDGEK